MMAHCVIEYDVLHLQQPPYFPLDLSKRKKVRIERYKRTAALNTKAVKINRKAIFFYFSKTSYFR